MPHRPAQVTPPDRGQAPISPETGEAGTDHVYPVAPGIPADWVHASTFSWVTLLFTLIVSAPLLLAFIALLFGTFKLDFLWGIFLLGFCVQYFGGAAYVKWRYTPADIQRRLRELSLPMHPDSDVDALLRKEIDLGEYARRKSAQRGK